MLLCNVDGSYTIPTMRLQHWPLTRLALVLLLTLAALVPFLDPRLPLSADGKLHLFRTVEMDWLLRNGILWPRIAPDMAYGYGYPIFNYYAPLLYYVITAIHRLGLDFVPALHLALAGSILIGALGAFRLAEDQSGPTGTVTTTGAATAAGAVAAALYAFAPYVLYDALRRGAASEAWALGLLPWLFWSVRRAALRPGAWSFARLALLYAALLLSHNITALIATPLLGGYALVLIASRRIQNAGCRKQETGNTQYELRITNYVSPLLALATGLALAAFFWLPALFEGDYVQLHQLTAPTAFDFRAHFLSLTDLLQLPPPFDPRQELPPVPFTPGLVQLGLAGLGIVALLRTRRPAWRLEGAYFALLLTLLLALTLPLSRPVWARIPLLRFVQFPWRFLGPTAVVSATLGGMAVAGWWGRLLPADHHNRLKEPGFWQPYPGHILPALALALLIAATALSAFSLTYTRRYPLITRPSLAEMYEYEVTSGALGTTSTGEFLPATVRQLPPPDSLRGRYAAGNIINRLDRDRLPPGVSVISEHSDLLAAAVVVDSPDPFIITFDWFHFPGWQARVDAEPTPIRPGDPYGLITFDVPAGRHAVEVTFGPTPLRQAAGLISIGGLLALGLLAYVLKRSGSRDPRQPEAQSEPFGRLRADPSSATIQSAQADFAPPVAATSSRQIEAPGKTLLLALALTGLTLGLFRFWLIERNSIFNRSRFDGQTVAGVSQTLDVNFGDRLALIGVDLPPATLPADQPLPVTLYWHVVQQLDADYSTSVKLLDDRGHLLAQVDSQHPGGWPTSRWSLESYARDLHDLLPFPGTPPGEYALVVTVYPEGGGSALDVFNPDHIPVGVQTELARITVIPPENPPDDQALAPETLLNASLGPLELVGLDLPLRTLNSGDLLPLVLYWRASEQPGGDLTARLSLTYPDGEWIHLADLPPVRADYPTSAWTSGEGLRAPHDLLIPPEAPAGSADLTLALLNPEGSPAGPAAELGQITIATPERSFEIPAMSETPGVKFGSSIELLGYDLTPSRLRSGDELAVTLYWRSLATVTTRYVVFVHLLNQSEQIVSQVDRVPLEGSRPTTGWLPGEILTDPYTLLLPPDTPPGKVLLEIGLYDPQTGNRLPVTGPTGQPLGDRLILAEIQVVGE